MKKHPEHKIDELLHGSLHNMQGETSAQDWAEISARLEAKSKDKIVFWFGRKYVLLLGLAMFLLAGAGFYFQVNIVEDSVLQKANSIRKNHIQLSEKMLRAEEKNAVINQNQSTKNNSSNLKYSAKSEMDGTKNYFINAAKEQRKNNENNFQKGKILLPNAAEYPEILNEKARAENIIPDTLPTKTDSIKKEIIAPEKLAKNEIKSVKKSNGILKKLSFGFSFSPGFTSNNLQTDLERSGQIHKNFFHVQKQSSESANSYFTGIYAQYNIWKNVSAQSGITYTRRVENVNYSFFNNDIPVIDSATKNILGYIELEDSVGTNYTGKNTYSYAEIPLKIEVTFPLSGKFQFALQAGGSAMFLLNAKGKTLQPDDLSLAEINNLRKTNFALSLSPAIYYRFQKYFSAGLQADYSQLLQTTQNKTSIIQTKPWNIGAGVSLRYNPF